MDPIHVLPYRPAACELPLIKAGHMSAPDYAPKPSKKFSCAEGGVHTCPEFSHIWFGLSGARPAQAGMAPLICWSLPSLVLQQLDVQITFGRPRGAGNAAQSGRGEVEGGLAVGEPGNQLSTVYVRLTTNSESWYFCGLPKNADLRGSKR